MALFFEAGSSGKVFFRVVRWVFPIHSAKMNDIADFVSRSPLPIDFYSILFYNCLGDE